MNTKTVNISLPPKMVTRIDRMARRRSANRSELIREALRGYLDRREQWEQLFAIGARQARKLGIKTEDDVVRLVREYRSEQNG